MVPEIYLITPENPDPESFPATLMAVLSEAEVAAILVRRGMLNDGAYARLATSLVNIGQGAGSAVLIEDDGALARRLGADGVHVTGGAKAIREAVSTLKPAMIVGAGSARSRHDAMTFGELDVDYVLFGPLGGSTDAQAGELAQWWSETFEVPAVLSDPGATWRDAAGAEFLALSDSIWSASSPAASMRSLVAQGASA